MRNISLVIFCASILILSGSQAFATQFIPYTGTIQNHKPIICVLDNSGGQDGLTMTRDIVNEWGDKLNHLTFSKNWTMTVQMTNQVHMTDCNIVFNYTLKPWDPISFNDGMSPKPVQGRILGMTSCDNEQYGHVYCQIDIYLLNNNPQILRPTVSHEFGHALGLGHRQGDTAHDEMRAFLSDDLMFASAKLYQHLTNEDALAVIDLYGHNGFGEPIFDPNENVYLIPYPTHIKVYCDGISGKICDSPF